MLSFAFYNGRSIFLRPIFTSLQTIHHAELCTKLSSSSGIVLINGNSYEKDYKTNISSKVLNNVSKKLHNQNNNPVNLVKRKIQTFFYNNYVNRNGNPLYTMIDNMDPVVTIHQNFDSLLVPKDHVSRSSKDSYYINEKYMLRAHTSSHQEELIKMGFIKFLVSGDVYRRDSIDCSHFPIFHQMEGVSLFTEKELFACQRHQENLRLFDNNTKRSADKQEEHSMEASTLLENNLKSTLLDVAAFLFGKELEHRWVSTYFPFTHPSWELEIMHKGEWLEVLGCGIMEQQILRNAGVNQTVGWAFGLGLDRLAMKLYEIPDIRLLWSEDHRFLNQFKVDSIHHQIKFKPFSSHPPCVNDMSFWIPMGYSENDFYDLVRNVGGETVEQVSLIDTFTQPGKQCTSHCYRLVYRHTDRALLQQEVNDLHQKIAAVAAQTLGVQLR